MCQKFENRFENCGDVPAKRCSTEYLLQIPRNPPAPKILPKNPYSFSPWKERREPTLYHIPFMAPRDYVIRWEKTYLLHIDKFKYENRDKMQVGDESV
jgi:hypothetical protein